MTPQHHWNTVFEKKTTDQVSWYEAYPTRSVATIQGFNLPLSARIIDVGGGDSRLVDALLTLGYSNITVLDLSVEALTRAQARLGQSAERVSWVVSDVTDFKTDVLFDAWHDRAAFHFLTNSEQVDTYLTVATRSLRTGGYATVGTFSTNGPDQCSGLPVRQYSPETLPLSFARSFTRLHCEEADHQTPSGTTQRFTFCQFQRH